MSKYKYNIDNEIKCVEEQLDECYLCDGAAMGCDEFDELFNRHKMLLTLRKDGYMFVDENDKPIKPNIADDYDVLDNGITAPKSDDDVDDKDIDDVDDEEDADLAIAALEDVLDIMDVSDKVLDILGDAEFETHVVTSDTYDSVNVSITTDFGYSTAVGKTYPYNICDNNELLSSVVFDLVRDIVIELEGNYTYMRLMFENCVD